MISSQMRFFSRFSVSNPSFHVSVMRFLLSLMCLFALSACQPEVPSFNGYVEGEYLYISTPSAGLLSDLVVTRGQGVQQGSPLFSLDLTLLNASHASALAELAQSRAKWNDLLKGSRPEEIEIILQQQEQARVALDVTAKDFARAQTLVASKAISQQSLDETKAAFDTAQARVAELTAQLKKAALGAREDEIAAAKAVMDMAVQKVMQLEKQIHDAAPLAPASGYIEDTFFNVGEFVNIGTPVVSLLPTDKIKVRFFVPQAKLAQVPLGRKVMVSCDGCARPIEAKISFISSASEYTPPVIYSIGSRDKLVFMVEATPTGFSPALRPGLPVDIDPGQP